MPVNRRVDIDLANDGRSWIGRCLANWNNFWFSPADPISLHALRALAGLLILGWLLSLAGRHQEFYGPEGWLDLQGQNELFDLRRRNPEAAVNPLGWNPLYLFRSTLSFELFYWTSLLAVGAFTLGYWTRITSVLTWLVVVAFTSHPGQNYDGHVFLLIFSFYLMVGYLLYRLNLSGFDVQELLGTVRAGDARPSSAANIALRLLQVHLAIVMVASGLDKLQSSVWWSGLALWFPLHPPYETTLDSVLAISNPTLLLTVLSLAAYAVVAYQISFPFLIWRSAWQPVMIAGAIVGGLGCRFVYALPLFGPAMVIMGLTYLPPLFWRRVQAEVRKWRAGEPSGSRMAASAPKLAETSKLLGILALLFACGCTGATTPPPADVSVAKQESAPATQAPAQTPPDVLRKRIEVAIDHVRSRQLLTTNAFWTIFHGFLAFGPDITLQHPQSGEKVRALDYILRGEGNLGQIRGLGYIPTRHGLDVQMGPMHEGQGHRDQWVAKMAQWDIPGTEPMVVFGKQYTVMDLVNEIKAHTRLNTELSWTVIAIGYYVGTDAEWINQHGEKITYEDMVRSEMNAPIDTAACGGSHRLHGLVWAYHMHLRNGGKKEGVWKDLAEMIHKYQRLAREYQSPDGGFSTNYFAGKGSSKDLKERLGSSGHIFEWLATSLPPEELKEQWMQDAANHLALLFLEIQDQSMESGALYHAVHGLLLYHRRVFGAETPNANDPKADLTLKSGDPGATKEQ